MVERVKPEFYPDNWYFAPAGSPLEGKVYTGKRWIDPPSTPQEMEETLRAGRRRSLKIGLFVTGGVVLYVAALLIAGATKSEAIVSLLVFGPIVACVLALYALFCREVANAAERKGRAWTPWFWIAFFFGIIIPAIIVAIMANQSTPVVTVTAPAVPIKPNFATKTCPFCAEEVKAAAVKCKHCGSDLA